MTATDPQLYARSFADVYQAWYDDLDDPGDLVAAFVERCRPGALIVELGSGTGRLSTPLHEAGFRVCALDSSVDMLARAQKGPSGLAADMAWIPLAARSVDAVVIAYNTLLNLDSRAQQQRCLCDIARVLRPGGFVAIEAFVAAGGDVPSFGVTVRDHPTDSSSRVAIVTGPDARDSRVIVGSHIELGDHIVCRPWRLHYQSPGELDQMALEAGLDLKDRFRDWAASSFGPDDVRHVSWYERR